MSISSEIRIITEVTLRGEGERDEYLEIVTDEGWTFSAVKTRNTFVESVDGEQRKLAYLLQPTAITRWWGGLGRPVHQIEALVQDKTQHPYELGDDSSYGDWIVVWEDCNDFQTLQESDAAGDAYAAFIEREADIIADAIDSGSEPQLIYDTMDDNHSGNTAAWAWNVGCARAKDQESAEHFRGFWNEKWAPDQDVPEGSTVNPAILHVDAGS
jgi:hypothetical protein